MCDADPDFPFQLDRPHVADTTPAPRRMINPDFPFQLDRPHVADTTPAPRRMINPDFPFQLDRPHVADTTPAPRRMINPDFPFQLDRPHIAEPPRVTITRDDVLRELALTPEQAADIAKYPQGSTAWLQARRNRLTASNFGAAAGMNKYKSPNGLLKDMLWNTFKGNAATRWGTEHEDAARVQYLQRMQADIDAGVSTYTLIRVEETGLHINPARPWLGSSPDGIVHVTTRDGASHKFLLEIKCPYRKVFYDPPVPTYYNCQIQGVMGNMNLPYCDFVVWTPNEMRVTRVGFDVRFWEHTLLPKLDHFFHNMYLPLAVAKHNGELQEGDTGLELRL